MKLFKKIAMLTMALALTFSVGALAACDGNGESSTPDSSTEQPAAASYKFKVVNANGEAVSGVQIQLCKGEDFCAMPVMTDANGKADYAFPNSQADAYSIHVWDAAMQNEYTISGNAVTSADYDGAEIVITIAE